MNMLFTYLFQSAISLIMLYLIYWAFLRKDTFFSANRFYLIGSILFSLAIPLININIPLSTNQYTTSFVLNTIVVTGQQMDVAVSSRMSNSQVFVVIYFTGVALFLLRFVFQLLQLYFIIKKYGIAKQDGLKIVFVNKNYSPFSFLNILFINKNSVEEKEIEEIIIHEKVHIKQKHSLDLILMETLTIFQWFNPIIWFYRHSIKSVHEFLADEGVILNGYKILDYKELIVTQTVGAQVNDLTNNFNKSLIKRRLIMLTKEKSMKMASLKTLFALPVVILVVMLFACNSSSKDLPANETNSDQQTTAAESDNDSKAFEKVDEMPSFPGGQMEMAKYIVSNIKYPTTAKEKGIMGKVFVQFIVEADGSVSNASVIKGIGGGCDEEALRVIQSMPKWIPGKADGKPVRVSITLPVQFKLA